MPAHGPIHLPTQEYDTDVSRVPKVTTSGIAFEVLRTVAIASALGLQVYSTVFAKHHTSFGDGSLPHRADIRLWFALGTWQAQAAYAACMTIAIPVSVYLASSRRHTTFRRLLQSLLSGLLLAVSTLIAYRTLFPLATYWSLVDPAPVWLTRSLLASITIAAVFVPLFQPCPATAAFVNTDISDSGDDSSNDSPLRDAIPNPQLTASIFSKAFYSFMDPVILQAFPKNSAFGAKDLPPVRPSDRSDSLDEKYMAVIDPIARKQHGLKERSLWMNVVGAFKGVSLAMAATMVVKAITEFFAPIALERLLTYVQNNGERAIIRPWVWIALLFIGPLLTSIVTQCYGLLSTTTVLRLESIFTQLLFRHALRIRMQDDKSKSTSEAGPSSAHEPKLIPDLTEELPAQGHQITEGTTIETAPVSGYSNLSSAAEINDAAEEAPEKQASLVGRITTLMSADIDQMMDARDIFLVAIYAPLQIVLGTVFLYQILSWSALVGMLASFLTLPLPGMLAKLLNSAQADLMKLTDQRVQAVTEALTTLRLVKTFAWESKVKQQLAEKRDAEIRAIKKTKILNIMIQTVVFMSPVLPMALTYGLYAGVEHKALTAAKVFSSISVFDMLRMQQYILVDQVYKLITVRVSLQRFDEFLQHTRLLDRFDFGIRQTTSKPAKPEDAAEQDISILNCDFAWQRGEEKDDANSSDHSFRLIVGSLKFPLGQTTIVSGPSGSGKSSLLMALLGEMDILPRNKEASVNLPRQKGVALCLQTGWIMEGTVRENILFGSAYNEVRYRQVLHQCALLPDLKLWEAGDLTELGEKGLTASGGQKARISLARAIYSSAQILLLDDVLAALDSHTTKFVVDKLFRGDLLKRRTVICVTHHVSLLLPVSDYLVNVSADGVVMPPQPVTDVDAKSRDSETDSVVIDSTSPEESDSEEAADLADLGRLLIAEEKAQGKVSRHAILQYFSAAGGILFWVTYFGIIVVGEILFAYCNFWLGIWARAYEGTDPGSVSLPYYLGIYIGLMLLQVMSYNGSSLLATFGCLQASRDVHQKLTASVLDATLRWLDTTPTGNMISRFTKDIKSCDSVLSRCVQLVSELSTTLALKLMLLIWLVPAFAPLAIAVGIVGAIMGEFYVRAQMNVKRESSNAKSPLYSQFAAAISGVISIRAYGAETEVQRLLQTKADHYTRCATAMYNLNRWVNLRMEIAGAVFSAGLAVCLVFGSATYDPILIGFGLNQAVSVSEIILYWVKGINEFEVQCNSIERLNEFLNIDKEPSSTEQRQPPASWPTSGEIIFENLSARYFAEGPLVLRNISLRIDSGSRVGVVGKTGSGKSTLTLSLLNMIPLEGRIIVSGQDIQRLNREILRRNVVSIPQDAVLLAGTLRTNLDPFDEYDDADLQEALKISGIGAFSEAAASEPNSSTARLTLDFEITSGGSNLSQGQRQLVSLARALVRRSKILILDEATASVDFETDQRVQRAIRNLHGVTILTVAHRLRTIMDYDKVLVLNEGQVLEYDSPKALLANPKGLLRSLVDSSSEKQELETLAGYAA